MEELKENEFKPSYGVSTPQEEGLITKIHSNYYYVYFDNITWECMLRNKIKKEGVDPKVGDKVLIESLNTENNTAAIASVFERKNEIEKPNIANIDQIVIVTSTYAPDFNPLQTDKFIVLAESNNIEPIICINKADQLDDELKEFIEEIYSKTGYKIIYTSAKEKNGLDELKKVLLDKTTVFTGVSGVGKSSLINELIPDLNLETKEVSKNLGTGRHTTRHVSLQKVFFDEHNFGFVADTPGFSFISFDKIYSKELAWYYKEFKPFISSCPLSGCLHCFEPNCNLKNNIDTESARYLNYLNILSDIINLEKIEKKRSLKKEAQVKVSTRADGKNIRVVKLGTQAKESSRRVAKQEIQKIQKTTSISDFEEDF
ncbi:MAG: ribosome small subunit-dependent GTPase A [Candidatus Sericytochromatia bacterium]